MSMVILDLTLRWAAFFVSLDLILLLLNEDILYAIEFLLAARTRHSLLHFAHGLRYALPSHISNAHLSLFTARFVL